ncbi:MAG: polyprenyl diphosphate synthase [Vicinamibacterales bacterium]
MTAEPSLHVAIIMDGNGRWATTRGLPRIAGHRQGAATVARTVEAAARTPAIEVLTLYAFSADNWRRPRAETLTLMQLFEEYLREEGARCAQNGIRLSVIGRRDRVPPSLCRRIAAVEEATAQGSALHLRLAIDYSARDALWLAAERMMTTGSRSREEFARRVGSGRGVAVDVPGVDLLIRTGGEQRLSDFLLWEAAYAELCFLDVAWPDFTDVHLADALLAFAQRDRRFGGLPDRAEDVCAGREPSPHPKAGEGRSATNLLGDDLDFTHAAAGVEVDGHG